MMLLALDPGKGVGFSLWHISDAEAEMDEVRLILVGSVNVTDASDCLDGLTERFAISCAVIEESPADRGMSWRDQRDLIVTLKQSFEQRGIAAVLVKPSLWKQALEAMVRRKDHLYGTHRIPGALIHARDAAKLGDWFISAGKHLDYRRAV